MTQSILSAKEYIRRKKEQRDLFSHKVERRCIGGGISESETESARGKWGRSLVGGCRGGGLEEAVGGRDGEGFGSLVGGGGARVGERGQGDGGVGNEGRRGSAGPLAEWCLEVGGREGVKVFFVFIFL